jgi:hypothetical protein
MEDPRQNLRTECRGGGGGVGGRMEDGGMRMEEEGQGRFGRIWPCIGGGVRREDGGRRMPCRTPMPLTVRPHASEMTGSWARREASPT